MHHSKAKKTDMCQDDPDDYKTRVTPWPHRKAFWQKWNFKRVILSHVHMICPGGPIQEEDQAKQLQYLVYLGVSFLVYPAKATIIADIKTHITEEKDVITE